MSLEEEIVQKRFNSEHEKMLINLIYTSSWLNAKQVRFFRKWGISPQQYNVLRILKGQLPDTVNLNLIKERMLDKMSNASRLVEKLKQKKWVSREINEEDRRAVDLRITEKGLAVLDEIAKENQTMLQEFMHITEAEAAQLNQLLDQFRCPGEQQKAG